MRCGGEFPGPFRIVDLQASVSMQMSTKVSWKYHFSHQIYMKKWEKPRIWISLFLPLPCCKCGEDLQIRSKVHRKHLSSY